MHARLILTLAAATLAPVATHAQDITGNWQGTLQAHGGIRILLKVSKEGDHLKAIAYAIDQGGPPNAVSALELKGSAISFDIPSKSVHYAGTLSPDGHTITGSATQGGHPDVLNLEHVTEENTWAIPKPPASMPDNAHPVFEVVTVKPANPDGQSHGFNIQGRRIQVRRMTVSNLISFAYGVNPKQILGLPAGFDGQYDMDGVPDLEGSPGIEQLRDLIKNALSTRFQLKFHNEQRDQAVYVLTVARGGPKLTPTVSDGRNNSNFNFRKLGALNVSNTPMHEFCEHMQAAVMDKPVVDHTGLTGRYDFQLNWTPDETQFAAMGARIAPPTDDPNAPPSLYIALQEQLGLKLEATHAPAAALVIDHLEKPSSN